ncbi:MAG: hypothetical protein HYW91_01595 [Candidatus Sungbacteria bacterium]|nr:hypothetical protein [Candidatus Sungbacteria bacterium]
MQSVVAVIAALAVILGVYHGVAASGIVVAPACVEIPESFESWKLTDVDEDGYRVIRWFTHPNLPACHGISVSLLLGCKEYPVIRSTFLLGKNDEAKEQHSTLRVAEDRWETGSVVEFLLGTGVETGEKSAVMVLDDKLDKRVEIFLTEPCASH